MISHLAAARKARKFAARFRWVLIANFMFEGWKTRRKFAAGSPDSEIGATHKNLSLEQSADYVDLVFTEYLRYSGLNPLRLIGKTVLEIGPGDNLGVALRFLACGARRVVCLDKFAANRSAAQMSAIYREIFRRLPAAEQATLKAAFNGSDSFSNFDGSRLLYMAGSGLENATRLFPPASFDFIISRAVIEEMDQPDAAFAAMDYLIASGGRMIHRIDLSDYRMFSGNGFHPLEFLTLPDRIYDVIALGAGKPNRRRSSYYRNVLESRGYLSQMIPLKHIGLSGEADSRNLVESIRPRLGKTFRKLSADDLIVSDLFLTALKL